MTSGAVLVAALAAACTPSKGMVGSESSKGISEVQDQCRRFLVETNGRGNFEVAALCRSKLPTAICYEASRTLGVQPWTPDRVAAACEKWEGEWAGRVLKEAATARGLDLDLTPEKKPPLQTSAPVSTLAPLPTLAPPPTMAPVPNVPPLPPLAPTPSVPTTRLPAAPHLAAASTPIPLPPAPMARMDLAAHRKGPFHVIERFNPWGRALSGMDPYVFARVLLPAEVHPRPHSEMPAERRRGAPTNHRHKRSQTPSMRQERPVVNGQVMLKVLDTHAKLHQRDAYWTIAQALAVVAGVEANLVTLSSSLPENGKVVVDYRIKLTSTIEMITAAHNLASTWPQQMTSFINDAAAQITKSFNVEVESFTVLDSAGPAARAPRPQVREPRHVARDFPPLPFVPDPRIAVQLRVPKSNLTVLGNVQFQCTNMFELRFDRRVQDALHQAVAKVLDVPLHNMTVNSVTLTPMNLLSAEAFVEVYFTVHASSLSKVDNITQIALMSSTQGQLDADIHRRLLAAAVSAVQVKVSSFAAEGSAKVQQALDEAAPQVPKEEQPPPTMLPLVPLPTSARVPGASTAPKKSDRQRQQQLLAQPASAQEEQHQQPESLALAPTPVPALAVAANAKQPRFIRPRWPELPRAKGHAGNAWHQGLAHTTGHGGAMGHPGQVQATGHAGTAGHHGHAQAQAVTKPVTTVVAPTVNAASAANTTVTITAAVATKVVATTMVVDAPASATNVDSRHASGHHQVTATKIAAATAVTTLTTTAAASKTPATNTAVAVNAAVATTLAATRATTTTEATAMATMSMAATTTRTTTVTVTTATATTVTTTTATTSTVTTTMTTITATATTTTTTMTTATITTHTTTMTITTVTATTTIATTTTAAVTTTAATEAGKLALKRKHHAAAVKSKKDQKHKKKAVKSKKYQRHEEKAVKSKKDQKHKKKAVTKPVTTVVAPTVNAASAANTTTKAAFAATTTGTTTVTTITATARTTTTTMTTATITTHTTTMTITSVTATTTTATTSTSTTTTTTTTTTTHTTTITITTVTTTSTTTTTTATEAGKLALKRKHHAAAVKSKKDQQHKEKHNDQTLAAVKSTRGQKHGKKAVKSKKYQRHEEKDQKHKKKARVPPTPMLAAWSATPGHAVQAAESTYGSPSMATLLALASYGAAMAVAVLGMRLARRHATGSGMALRAMIAGEGSRQREECQDALLGHE